MPREKVLPVDHRPSYLAAAIASAIIFGLYLLTLAPSTAMWDTSEYIAAAYVLGLPHPPGNPFFMILGHVVSLLPVAPTVAMRINMLAALCSAASAGMWFLIVDRVLSNWLPQRWQRVAGASVAAIVGATAFTVWNQSVVNEKVYMVSLAFFAIVSWLTVRWCDDPDGRTADRLLVLIAYLVGLGYTNHPAGFLVAPAVGVAVLVRRPQTLLRWRLLLACVGALALGLSLFLYEPIRAGHFPPLNEGEPTGCVTEFHLSCTFDHVAYERLKDNINRVQYAKPSLLDRQASFGAQLGMYWLYFEWQWMRDPVGQWPGVQMFLALVFLALGLAGGYVHWRRDPRSFWFFGPLVFTITLLLVYYMNFKYGYSQAPELGNSVPREVRDRDYFYLWSFSAWSVWVGLGLVLIWEQLAGLLSPSGAEDAARIPRAKWLVALPVLALGVIPLFTNWHAASRHGDWFTRDWAVDLLNSVEPYGVLITNGDNDTFPLWYAQEVEGVRKDVTVAVTSLLGTDWFVRQIIRRPVVTYDAAKGPIVYRNREWPKPTGPPLHMTLAEADAVPPVYEVTQPMQFRKDSIVATIKPGMLTRDQLLVLRMLRDSYPEHPLFFTSSSYLDGLGLRDYAATQGIAVKLFPAPPPVNDRFVHFAGFGAVDVPRSDSLWNQVYLGPTAMIDLGKWIDRASADIPLRYVITGAVIAEALTRQGKTAEAQTIMTTARAVAKAARIEGVLRE